MIIDFHTHIFPDALAKRAIDTLLTRAGGVFPPVTDGTHRGLISSMNEAGIDISIIQPVITKQSQTVTINEWAASLASDRIVPFGGIFPHTDDYKRDIDFVVSLGLKGIKLHAEGQGFTVDEPKMLKIYDYAFERGLIILQHAGYDPGFPPPYHSSPEKFKNVVRRMQGGVMIAAHLGGQSQWDEVERHLVGENIYLDTSMGQKLYPEEQFLRIARTHGADKILFGTDSPWSCAKDEVELISALPLSDEEKALILSDNAKRLLSL